MNFDQLKGTYSPAYVKPIKKKTMYRSEFNAKTASKIDAKKMSYAASEWLYLPAFRNPIEKIELSDNEASAEVISRRQQEGDLQNRFDFTPKIIEIGLLFF